MARRYATLSAILLPIAPSDFNYAYAAPAITASVAAVAPSQAPRLDGDLDEPVWRDAPSITELLQVAPVAGAGASVLTDVRMVQDGSTLFVAITAREQPGYVRSARQTRRDALLEGDDHVSLVLDPAHGGRNGYQFSVNANGAQYDALIFDGAEPREDWDAIWDARVQSNDDGWTAELAIPLSALTANDGGDWGLNVERYLAGSGERLRWRGMQPDRTVTNLRMTGLLSGVPSQAAGHGLRIKPSVRLRQHDQSGDRESEFEPGFDVFWRMRPDTTATLTLNSDFAEAEADDRELNLTRYPLLLPEKREFFLQDAGVFAFGGLQENLMPFFSRRIGLSSDGTPLALDGGVKLTHESQAVEAGLLVARVEPSAATDAASVGVGRVAMRIGEHSRLGAIGTVGNPAGTDGSSTWGIDWQYRNPQFIPDRNLAIDVWTQTSDNDPVNADVGGSGSAHGVFINWENIGPVGNIGIRRVDEEFAPALGFVLETGIEQAVGEAGYWWRTQAGGDVIPQLDWEWNAGLHDDRHYSMLNPEIYISNAQGDYLLPEIFFEQETLIEDFEIVPGLIIPAGEYRFQSTVVYAVIGASSPLSGEASVRWGEFYDGEREDYTLSAVIRPQASWGITLRGQRTDMHLPAGTARVHLAAVSLEMTPTPWLAANVLTQWDDISDEVGLNLRLNWIIEPGQNVFVSFNRLFLSEDGLTTIARDESIKLAWNWMW